MWYELTFKTITWTGQKKGYQAKGRHRNTTQEATILTLRRDDGGMDKSGNVENDRNTWNLDRNLRGNIAKEVGLLHLESRVEVQAENINL